jgi:hypothetical protein
MATPAATAEDRVMRSIGQDVALGALSVSL